MIKHSILILILSLSALNAQAQTQSWTLQDCIDYAIEHSITLQKSHLQERSSAANLEAARAALFPTLNIGSTQSYNNQPYGGAGSFGRTFNDGSINTYSGSYNLNGQLTLYNGGRNVNNIRYQQMQTEIAKLATQEQVNTITLAVAQAFVQVVYATEALSISMAQLQADSALLAMTQAQVAQGLKTKVDVVQMEAQVAADKYSIVQAQTSLAQYRLNLRQLLELTVDDKDFALSIPNISTLNPTVALPPIQETYATAMLIMPEIRGAMLVSTAARLNEKIARASWMPNIALQASSGTGHNSVSQFNFGEQLKRSWSNTVGMSISVPILDNKQTKTEVSRAKLSSMTAELDMLDKYKALYKTIETAWQNANSSQNEYIAAGNKEHFAQASYDLVIEQYRQGMKTTIEILTERATLISAQQSRLQAKYMALLNLNVLKFYAGTPMTL